MKGEGGDAMIEKGVSSTYDIGGEVIRNGP